MTEEQAAPKKRNDPTSQLARGELVHAEVKPLDLSGIPTVIVGIIAWAVAFVVLLIFRDELEEGRPRVVALGHRRRLRAGPDRPVVLPPPVERHQGRAPVRDRRLKDTAFGGGCLLPP